MKNFTLHFDYADRCDSLDRLWFGNDIVIKAVQNVWKTSQPEHLGPDLDCAPILRFLGMSLERVDTERSTELNLPVGSILLNQLEYIIEVLMKFEPTSSRLEQPQVTKSPLQKDLPPSVQVKKSVQNTLPVLASLEALVQEEIVDIDANTKLHYNSEQNLINLPAIVGCLNWIALRSRPDIAWAIRRAASLITHDPDTCFIRVKPTCQYLHHTLGHALRYPIPPQSKHKSVGTGRCLLCSNRGEESTRTNCISRYRLESEEKRGNLVQW